MKHFLFLFLVVLMSCTTVPPTSDLRWKTDDRLYDVVDRYSGAELDTVVSIEAELTQTITDARRSEIVRSCDIRVLDRFDSTAMIVAPSKSLPCLSRQPEFKSFRMVPAWSPDL